MKSRFYITVRNISRLLMLAGCISVFVSCNDDSLMSSADDENIKFTIRTDSYAPSAGRSCSQVQTLSTGELELVADENRKLYLSGIEEDWKVVPDNSISSRSSVFVSESPETFGVFATIISNSQPYMVNTEVRKSGDVWIPAAEYLWPGDGGLHFMNYAPYYSVAQDEGITKLPSLSETGNLNLNYKLHSDISEQEDLLWGTPTDASSSPCALTMNHALTAIRFVTGTKMTPCTVKKITVSNVMSAGNLDIENGSWSEQADVMSFEINSGVELTAESGSNYVTSDISLIPDDGCLYMLPHTLGNDAELSIEVESSGSDRIYTASLSGSEWKAGKAITYRLSASPALPDLILEVTDSAGVPLSEISTAYTGGISSFRVKSLYSDEQQADQPVDWDAVFIDADGNELAEAPDWIISFPTSGSGDAQYSMRADLPEPEFLQMSDNTRRLRQNADINTSSGHDCYNLASSTGAMTDENTANSYIINAPGHYCIPLVYGNAIKDGATNSSSYESTVRVSNNNNKITLYKFINHLGNEITDPYIYNNTGCQPDTAKLIWEGRLNIVRNVKLSDDGKYLCFDIPAASIRQSNAVVGVYDKNGDVMWSWHLWVTDLTTDGLFQEIPNPSNSSITYKMFSCSLGRIYGGDVTLFKPKNVTVRLTQKNVPEGMTPLTKEINVHQDSTEITTNDSHPFYQWGRKDPMISGLNHFYGSDHNIIDGEKIASEPFGTVFKDMIVEGIRKPAVFFTSNDIKGVNPYYENLWNINNQRASLTSTVTNVKTIYDPCPVGSKIPLGGVFLALSRYPATYDETAQQVSVVLPDGSNVIFTTMGYRTREGGEIKYGNIGSCWCAMSQSVGNANYLFVEYKYVETNGHIDTDSHSITFGFGVRPVED